MGVAFAALNSFIGPRQATPHKQDPYECGLPSEVKREMRFGISFYLIAMLFILFDIEVIFLFPVAIQLKAFGTFALVETIVFIALLLVFFIQIKFGLLGFHSYVPIYDNPAEWFKTFILPWIAIALYIAVALLWFVPDRRIEKII